MCNEDASRSSSRVKAGSQNRGGGTPIKLEPLPERKDIFTLPLRNDGHPFLTFSDLDDAHLHVINPHFQLTEGTLTNLKPKAGV